MSNIHVEEPLLWWRFLYWWKEEEWTSIYRWARWSNLRYPSRWQTCTFPRNCASDWSQPWHRVVTFTFSWKTISSQLLDTSSNDGKKQNGSRQNMLWLTQIKRRKLFFEPDNNMTVMSVGYIGKMKDVVVITDLGKEQEIQQSLSQGEHQWRRGNI